MTAMMRWGRLRRLLRQRPRDAIDVEKLFAQFQLRSLNRGHWRALAHIELQYASLRVRATSPLVDLELVTRRLLKPVIHHPRPCVRAVR